jgi:hypothetical protein
MLRDKYLFRNDGKDYTFHSVALAGVYDIKNIKHKIVLSGKHTPSPGESQVNSPWNIAADFEVDMSFSAKEIETMLVEYENDYHTGMNIEDTANEIRFYTSGYPYLVSRICMLIDTGLDGNWTLEGVREAVKLILKKSCSLFDDLFKKIEDNEELSDLMFNLTVGNKKYEYHDDVRAIKTGIMFCFLAENTEQVQVHNRIFAIRIANYFVVKSDMEWDRKAMESPINEIVKGNVFNMKMCLDKFKQHYAEIYSGRDVSFFEKYGKLIFLTYLKPLINSVGFYHIEPETRDGGKMDLVVDYLSQQFIVELKLWYGESKHEEAFEQLAGYLKSKNADCGYLLTFDFRKKPDSDYAENKWKEHAGKRIYDAVVRVVEKN